MYACNVDAKDIMQNLLVALRPWYVFLVFFFSFSVMLCQSIKMLAEPLPDGQLGKGLFISPDLVVLDTISNQSLLVSVLLFEWIEEYINIFMKNHTINDIVNAICH